MALAGASEKELEVRRDQLQDQEEMMRQGMAQHKEKYGPDLQPCVAAFCPCGVHSRASTDSHSWTVTKALSTADDVGSCNTRLEGSGSHGGAHTNTHTHTHTHPYPSPHRNLGTHNPSSCSIFKEQPRIGQKCSVCV